MQNLIEGLNDKQKEAITKALENNILIITGGPGTGKTTVARLLADILYSMRYIKNNKVAEVKAQDFVAGYIYVWEERHGSRRGSTHTGIGYADCIPYHINGICFESLWSGCHTVSCETS